MDARDGASARPDQPGNPGAPGLLGRDYWLVLSTPEPSVTAADIGQHVDEHVAWLLGLEAEGTLFLSGPLVSGPGTGPGSGVTILRAPAAEDAATIAAADPFVQAGLRTFQVFGWRVNEGAIGVQLCLGAGGYTWA
jgi:hypothetical protein